MKKILVPTDFSVNASNAVRFAYLFSKENGYKFSLLNVYNFAVYDPTMPPEILADVIKQSAENSDNGLKLLMQEFQKEYSDFDKYIFCELTAEGNVIEAIENSAADGKYDFIIMGTKGASGIEEALIGSNAYSVLAKAKIPVVVVPENAKYSGFKNILYGLDLESSEFPALDQAKQIIDFGKTNLTFLHLSGELEDALSLDEKKYFDEVKEKMKDVSCSFIFEQCVSVPDALEKVIHKMKADLLILSKKKRNFLDNLFHKSISKKLACHTDIPLLALHK